MTEPLPTNAIIASLRILAGSEPDATLRQELFDSANELEQVLARTQFAHAPTRDQMQAALWGAQTGLNDRLDEILRTSVAALDVAQQTQRQVMESAARLGKLEVDLMTMSIRVDVIDARTDPDLSAEERRRLIAMVKENRKRIIALEAKNAGAE